MIGLKISYFLTNLLAKLLIGQFVIGQLLLDSLFVCSSKLTVFLEIRSRETVHFSKQIMSAHKYASIFSRQMEAIVYISKR